MVEIAKALSLNARLVIMDEPTSALTDTEVTALFRIIRGLKARGLAVIYISHRFEEIFAICDRVTVLRDGQLAGEFPIAEATPDRVVRLMVGRPLADLFHSEEAERRRDVLADQAQEPVLEVRGLGRTGTVRDAAAIVLDDVTFSLRPGEIVGLAGLVGSGRTELARAIFGADAFDRGEVSGRGPTGRDPLAPRRDSPRHRARPGRPQAPGADPQAGDPRERQPLDPRPARPVRGRATRGGAGAGARVWSTRCGCGRRRSSRRSSTSPAATSKRS